MSSLKKTVLLKSIKHLEEEHINFYVDSYQRGYRWSEEEVLELHQDLDEFCQKHYADNSFYCMQPIIVTYTKETDSWKVIDGQQRLTTMYLLDTYFKGIFQILYPNRYQISYKNKPLLSECLDKISKFSEDKIWDENRFNELSNEYGNDIDCYYVIRAFNSICNELNRYLKDRPMDLSKLNNVFHEKTKVIWYDLQAESIEEETASFRKENMGKIPLTNAELIKALLLREDNDDNQELENYKKNIAVFWNRIEQELSDDRFWYFLTNANPNDYPNRIDFVFDILSIGINDTWGTNDDESDDKYIVKRDSNIKYFSFHVIYNYIEWMKNNPDPKNKSYVERIWNEVEEYYRMFRDWYHKKQWYHLIGYLISTSNEKYRERVCEISKLYRDPENGKKTSFVTSLTNLVNSSIRKVNKKPAPFVSVDDLVAYLTSNEFTYLKNQKGVENILLLYNIALTNTIDNKYTRFPFYEYKNSKLTWSLEHINPQKEDKPKNDKERIAWLNNLYMSIGEITANKDDTEQDITTLKNNIKEAKQKIDNEEFIDPASFSDLYDQVIDLLDEEQGIDHTIKNLVLLDTGTNSSLSNSIFPVKRRLLIELYKKEDVFIPVCTRNVFFKAYPESKELLKWNSNDKDTYFNDIKTTIAKYLNIGEEADENG